MLTKGKKMQDKALRLEQKEVYYPLPYGKGYVFLYRLFWDNTERLFLYHFGQWFENRLAMLAYIDARQEQYVDRSKARHTVAYKGEQRAILPWQWEAKKDLTH